MWVLMAKGLTWYVKHVTIAPGIGFSTKETADNPHTKAAIKVKGRLTIENDEAIITP